VGTERQVGRIDEIADVLDVGPGAGRGVDAIDMDTVAARLALRGGERADIGEARVGALRVGTFIGDTQQTDCERGACSDARGKTMLPIHRRSPSLLLVVPLILPQRRYHAKA